MFFIPVLALGSGTSKASFEEAVRAGGGAISSGEPDPATGITALRVTGAPVAAAGLTGLVVFAAQGRLVRAVAHAETEASMAAFGVPRRQGDGSRMWAWEHPRWSVEARGAESTWILEAKFLDEAIAAGVLSSDYVAGLYASN